MHICVNYFVKRPTLCMAPVGFQLDFFTVVKRTETVEKTRLSGKVVFRWMIDLVTQ